VDDVAALQAAADRLKPALNSEATRLLDLPFGAKVFEERTQQVYLSRLNAIAQVEYCRNFVFQRHFPIHRVFERSCEIGRGG
jgi:hypothetical protein